jgi:hypothetical protein
MSRIVCALALGREGSKGFPGKNLHPVMSRPLMAYPLMAAKASKIVSRLYLSTDSEKMKAVGREYGARIIDRPPELATDQALGEDAYLHGYRVIREEAEKEGHEVELMVLLFCNAPTVTGVLIDDGVTALRLRPELDSAVSASAYNMWSPLRARKIGPDGFLHPFVPFETFGDPKTLNCDRNSQGDVWFADMGVSVVRPENLENMSEGLLPQKWMGRTIHPIKQWGGLDVDFDWQIPQVEHWLKAHGIKPAQVQEMRA